MSSPSLVAGRYEIVRKLAEGGMGSVYEAIHTLSKRTVALKLLTPDVARDDVKRQRFLREVSAPAQIGHDGIVEVTDAGFDEKLGVLFVVMELLNGETLRARMERSNARESIDDREALLDLFDRLLQPVAAAHARGIVHRDLKPENVFLHRRRDGAEIVKVLDFGIARELDPSQPSVTQTGVAMGTPHYMAPEQAMDARGATFPADVWALGAMLYEMLGGATPFRGDGPGEILAAVVTEAHRPLVALAPNTPKGLVDLVDRCLSKLPEGRPRHAGELLEELRTIRGRSAPHPPAPNATTPTPAPSFPTAPARPNAPAASPVTVPAVALTPPPATAEGPSTSPVARPSGFTPATAPAVGIALPTAPTSAPTALPSALGAPAAAPVSAWQSGPGTPGPRPPQPTAPMLDASLGSAPPSVPSMPFAHGLSAPSPSAVPPTSSGPSHAPSHAPIIASRPSSAARSLGVGLAAGGLVGGAGCCLVSGILVAALVWAGGMELPSPDGPPGDLALESAPHTLRGSLDGSEPVAEDRYVETYRVTSPGGLPLTVDVESDTFDTTLVVVSPSGVRSPNDDRGDGSTNSRVGLATTEPGVYELLVSTFEPEVVGDFVVRISQ